MSLYGYGLRYGGPLGVVGGWVLVSLMTLPIAASLAELASAFPTAGALYHWSSLLGGAGFGWLTAWINLLGQFAITAGIDWGLVEMILPTGSVGARLGLFAALLGLHGALNHVGIRAVNLLARVSAWYHLAGVALLVGVLALVPAHQPLAFLGAPLSVPLTPPVGGGFGYGYAFCISLLMAGWTFTGYDASAHVSEETHDAALSAPRGIFHSVLVSAVFGGLLVVAVTLSITDVARVADPATGGFSEALAQAFPTRPLLARLLALVAPVAMWFCGLASLTSNSRMIFAFARDGGMPLATTWATVSPRFRTPAAAVWLSVGGAFAVAALCAVWGQLRAESASDVLNRITSASTVGLYVSYGLPIALGLWARLSRRWQQRGPWHLGRFGPVLNLVALLWIAAFSTVSMLPPNAFVAWMFVAALALLAAYWLLVMRHRFRGPSLRLADLGKL